MSIAPTPIGTSDGGLFGLTADSSSDVEWMSKTDDAAAMWPLEVHAGYDCPLRDPTNGTAWLDFDWGIVLGC